MAFNLIIDYRADEEIDQAIGYHLKKSPAKAQRLYNAIQEAYALLKENPFFQNRYAQIHCLPIPKFHYMFHYSINEKIKTVYIHALINTNKDPNTNWIK
jgi:plasmid stabilization system protein ParE